MRRVAILCVVFLLLLFAGRQANAGVLIGLGVDNISGRFGSSNLYTVDTLTGAVTLTGNTGVSLRGLAYNDITGKAYASRSHASGGGGLYEIDLTTANATYIGGSQNFSEMEFDASGNLWGYGDRRESTPFNYYNIDVNTGAGNLVTSSAFSTQHGLFGITYSNADSKMYLYEQFRGRDDGLYEINVSTGTLINRVIPSVQQLYRPDIAEDENGNMYAIADDRSGLTSLAVVNKSTALTTTLGGNNVYLQSIAFSNSAAVPEPSSVLILTGLGIFCIGRRRRRTNAPAQTGGNF